MNTHRILVPTDFSACSKTALSIAVTLAEGTPDSQVTLVHVEESGVPTFDDDLGVLEPDTLRTEIQALAASRNHNVNIDARVVYGDPNTQIVKFANDNDCDLIVMGTHGRSGIVQVLLGSTAAAVIRSASCPVMTVRDRRDAAEENRSAVVSLTQDNEASD